MPELNRPDYEGETIRQGRANVAHVLPSLESGNQALLTKIDSYCERTGYFLESVLAKIRTDEMFRAQFAIAPGRQGIHEKMAAAFIERIPGVENFKTLSKGKNGYVILRGAVMKRAQAKEQGASHTAKTIDFLWEYHGKKIYASHKYTQTGGGNQDNQYEDVHHFLGEANPSNLADTFFLAIADGAYFLTQDSGTGTTRLQALKNVANRRNVFALSIDELDAWLTEHCPEAA